MSGFGEGGEAGGARLVVSLDLDALSRDMGKLRRSLAFKAGDQPTAMWSRYVTKLANLETDWVKRGLITPGSFRSALVVLADRGGHMSGRRMSEAALLLTLMGSFDDRRQQKSSWAVALQKVLDGHVSAAVSARIGLKATRAVEPKKTKARKKVSQPRAKQRGIAIFQTRRRSSAS